MHISQLSKLLLRPSSLLCLLGGPRVREGSDIPPGQAEGRRRKGAGDILRVALRGQLLQGGPEDRLLRRSPARGMHGNVRYSFIGGRESMASAWTAEFLPC